MKSVAVFVFPGVQTLDLFGPIELLGGFFDQVKLPLVAQTADPLVTRHGQRIIPDATIEDAGAYDILFVPGGDSALDVPDNPRAMAWLTQTAADAELVMTVCTGSILLALTGALDGVRATTNKQDFRATVPYRPQVTWVEKARWVQDGKFFTSSGVSAGMDMALAVATHLFGQDAAEEMADGTEYEWHQDPSWDPFADKVGLGQDRSSPTP